MSAVNVGRLTLRPHNVFFAAGFIWVLDTQQPVAALIEPSTRQLVRLVDWSDLPPGSRTPTVVADDAGLWVQHGRPGPIARVGPAGIEFAEYSHDCALVCAGKFGAWCMPTISRTRDIARAVDTPPFVRREQQLLHVRRDGGSDSVTVEGILCAVDDDESSVFVGVQHDPWMRVPRVSEHGTHVPGEFEIRYASSWLKVPLSQPVPSRIGKDEFRSTKVPPIPGDSWHTSEYADQFYNEDHKRKRALGRDIRWHWGKDRRRNGVTVVKAYGQGAKQPICELELPGFRVVSGCTAGDMLWLVVWSETRTGDGMSVVTVDPGQDRARVVEAVEDVDIDDHRWSQGPEPLDHASFVDYCVRRLDGNSFGRRVSDVHAHYVGSWPGGRIRLSFRHSRFPDLLLVSEVNLYDEQGRRLDNLMAYVPVELMERADTLAYPPASRAVDGVLYI